MTRIRLELLTDNNMLLIVKKRVSGGICHAIHKYAKTNNKYPENHNKYKESLFLINWDKSNLLWMDNVSKITCRWF